MVLCVFLFLMWRRQSTGLCCCTKDNGEEIIAPRKHIALLYMNKSPPKNKQNLYLSDLFLSIYSVSAENLQDV